MEKEGQQPTNKEAVTKTETTKNQRGSQKTTLNLSEDLPVIDEPPVIRLRGSQKVKDDNE